MLFNNPPIRYLIAAEFLAAIATREAAIPQRLYDGAPRPLEFSGNEYVSGDAVLRRLTFQPGAGSDTCPVTLSTTISVSRQVIRGSLP